MVRTGINERVSALIAHEEPRAAYDLLNREAASGDADAIFTLAMWRIGGSVIARDLAAARALLGTAAHAGHVEAALLHAYFLASGTGGPTGWPDALRQLRDLAPTNASASRQITLIDAMSLVEDGEPRDVAAGDRFGTSPFVSLSPEFLSADEAAYVREIAAPSLQPSMVVDPVTGRCRHHPIRTSDEAMFGVFTTDLVITAINRRIAALSKTSPDQGEPLIVLRYGQGGEYRAHSDSLPGTDNQRIATVILYLNTDYEGGETRFVETGLTVRGQVGDALLFHNVTPDGRPDLQSRHAGLPINDGVKWIATRWIRARTYTYPAPRPALT